MPKSIDQQIIDTKNQIKKYQKKLRELEKKKVEMILKRKNAIEKEEIENLVRQGKDTQKIINTFAKDKGTQ